MSSNSLMIPTLKSPWLWLSRVRSGCLTKQLSIHVASCCISSEATIQIEGHGRKL